MKSNPACRRWMPPSIAVGNRLQCGTLTLRKDAASLRSRRRESSLERRRDNRRDASDGIARRGVCAARRPGNARRSGRAPDRYPRGFGVSRRRARLQGEACGTFPLPRLLDARETQGGVRGRACGEPAVRTGYLSACCRDHAAQRRPRAERPGRAGRMGGRDAPLRRERDAGSPGGAGRNRRGARRRTRARGRGGARGCAGRRGRAVDRGARALHRAERRGVP